MVCKNIYFGPDEERIISLLSMPIFELDISIRTYLLLQKVNIVYIMDIFPYLYDDLSHTLSVGLFTQYDIIDALNKLGFDTYHTMKYTKILHEANRRKQPVIIQDIDFPSSVPVAV